MTPLGPPEVLLDRSFVVIFTLEYCVFVFYMLYVRRKVKFGGSVFQT